MQEAAGKSFRPQAALLIHTHMKVQSEHTHTTAFNTHGGKKLCFIPRQSRLHDKTVKNNTAERTPRLRKGEERK